MTFLQSIFLFGLFAALLPLIIHLFSRRKKERISFSSLYFLKILESKKIRRLKLKQILLLLLRMIVISLLVFAFARPTLVGDPAKPRLSGVNRDGANYAVDTPISAVLIIDNSLSTAAVPPSTRGEGTSMFELIRRKALQVLETLKDGDEMYLLFSTDTGDDNTVEAIFDIDVLRRQIRAARISNRPCNLVDALQTGYSLLALSTNLYREIFLISDMQEVSFPPDVLLETEINEAAPIRVFCIKPESQSFVTGNVGITGAVALNQILEQGKQITLRAATHNFGSKPVSNLLVNLYLDGRRVAQKEITLEAHSSAAGGIDFQVIPERSGIIEGMVEIEEDALSDDNRRHFVITIPDKISVLMINGNPAEREANAFLQSVYASEVARQFTILTISEQQVSAVDFKAFDVVIYNGFTNLTQADVYRLRNFCAGGGGVIIFPAEQSNLISFNESIAEAFSLPKATGFSGKLLQSDASAAEYYSIETIDFSHPLFVNMFKQERPELSMPQIFLSADFTSPGTRAARTIMTMSNNKPFLIETRVEQGAFFLFASAPSLSWTTLPLKGIFTPLMHRLVYYLSQSGSIDNNDLLIGDEISFLYSGDAAGLSVVPPVGENYKLNPTVASEAFRVEFARTDNPGIYSFKSGDEIYRKFAVNIDTRESDLRTVSTERLKIIFGELPFIMWDKDENIAECISEVRSGREISRYLIIAVLAFLLLETILQHEKSSPKPDKS